MKRAYVVSDLHMFCRRSDWHKFLPEMHGAAADADLFVFNGDTFDFKWSTSGVEETVKLAGAFLEGFCKKHPKCQFHVNLGNHDHVPELMQVLESLSNRLKNLTWHPYYLRVENTVFLHGDVANWKMRHKHLERYRRSWSRPKKQGKIKNTFYDTIFRAGAHVTIAKMAFPHERTLSRVQHYLQDIGHGPGSGVEHVYFGHTHVPVQGYEFGGQIYYNGGASLQGVEFSLLKAVV